MQKDIAVLERIFLAVFAFLSDWIKNQDGKLVLMFAFCVLSISYLYNENVHLKNKVAQMEMEVDSLRTYVLECELHRHELEIMLNRLKQDLSAEKEANKKVLESRNRKDGKPR